jgi:hypothetical protein
LFDKSQNVDGNRPATRCNGRYESGHPLTESLFFLGLPAIFLVAEWLISFAGTDDRIHAA